MIVTKFGMVALFFVIEYCSVDIKTLNWKNVREMFW